MRRKLALLTLFTLACSSTMAVADDAKKAGKGAGKVDRSKLFDKMDANGDGKLTKEEYKTFLASAKSKLTEKGKGGKAGGKAGDVAEKAFDKMDTNKDGVVSKEEFLSFDPKAAAGKGKAKKGE